MQHRTTDIDRWRRWRYVGTTYSSVMRTFSEPPEHPNPWRTSSQSHRVHITIIDSRHDLPRPLWCRHRHTSQDSGSHQSQTVVTIHLPSNRLGLFALALWVCTVQRQTAVTAYFSSKQLLLFVFARQIDARCHNSGPVTLCSRHSPWSLRSRCKFSVPRCRRAPLIITGDTDGCISALIVIRLPDFIVPGWARSWIKLWIQRWWSCMIVTLTVLEWECLTLPISTSHLHSSSVVNCCNQEYRPTVLVKYSSLFLFHAFYS